MCFGCGAAQERERRATEQAAQVEEGEGEENPPDTSMVTTKAVLNVLGAGPTTPMGQDLIHVNPPKLDDYSSDEVRREYSVKHNAPHGTHATFDRG